VDDPTRLLRLVRYGTRLGFVLHPRTEQLARAALAEDAPQTAGVARIGRELWLLLGEPEAVAGLELLAELGDGELPGPAFAVDPALSRRVLELLPADASRERALLAGLATATPADELRAWLDAAHVQRAEVVLDAARDPAALAAAMRSATTPSELATAVRGRPVEAIAVAGALGDAAEPAQRWLDTLRHIQLEIGGADLLAAGVPQGPEIGRRLATALDRKLDGTATGRAEELAAALDDPPGPR
jgi:tRNA nucleotidyltransferase (CCA-adding enzyme)